MDRLPTRIDLGAAALATVTAVLAVACGGLKPPPGTSLPPPISPLGESPVGFASADPAAPQDIHKIKHVIIIVQENRSFDSYFGTYPGADGIPMQNGAPTVCSPGTGTCQAPYHDPNDINAGGPHTAGAAVADINGGRMNGFVDVDAVAPTGPICKADPNDPRCAVAGAPDVMGYHDAREIPNYWRYAQDFVLQDHLFEPNLGWSLPAHLYLVSAWSARCTDPMNPMTCRTEIGTEQALDLDARPGVPDFGWTDITYLLHAHGISWGYYVDPSSQPDCDNGTAACNPGHQRGGTLEIWNPLPDFVTVHQNGQVGNVQPSTNFFQQAAAGTLPAVSWVIPSETNSEHPPNSIHAGQAWVTSLINAVMAGPDWWSSAIFVTWDDWGGFYDHVVPPRVDGWGYGIRVPGLMLSPFARRGFIDHQVLSFDAYLKFIEDLFLGGSRLDPLTDGRPDPRPDVRETAPIMGDLANEFDFTQIPRPPLLLPIDPPPGPASVG